MEGERHGTKRQGEADGERSAEKAMVEGRIRQAHQRPPISIRAPQAQKISPQPESASPSYSFPTAVAPPTAHKTETRAPLCPPNRL